MKEEQEAPLKTGWYLLWGERAHCIVRPYDVAVTFEDGSYTCAYHDTFRAWGPVVCEGVGNENRA